MRFLIATGSFPYLPGEQFIESEIGYWGNLDGADIALLPAISVGSPRFTPEGVQVRPAARHSLSNKLLAALKAVFHPLFWRELKYLVRSDRLNVTTCFSAFRSVVLVLFLKAAILRRLHRDEHVDLAYSYWNDEMAYALCLLKREGRIARVISRAHGFDLYEARRSADYMPVKRQFLRDFDCVHAISDNGLIFLRDIYGFPAENLRVSRLGIGIPEGSARTSQDGVVRIVSVSFCVAVKRIDRIIEAVHHLCSSDPAMVVEWLHIGDGSLKQELEAKARQMLAALPNARFQFAGHWSNGDVLDYFRNNPVDLFINSSASEGIPVSIMEAMAFGIPAIAPDVGGVSELVNEQTGVLLDAEMRPQAIDAAVRKLIAADRAGYRERARTFVTQWYSASQNYSRFVSGAVALAMHK